MTKLHRDATTNKIAIYIRDNLIDPYAGEDIPDNVIQEIREIFATPEFRRKIYKGREYRAGFKQVLRQYRIDIIETIIR